MFSRNIRFREKISLLKDYKPIPVSGPSHLLKNGRTHLLNYPVLLDKSKIRCVNVSLLQEAVQLGAVIADKSTIGEMKGSYILKLFSWDVFVNLLKEQRFDGAFYIAPFMFLLHAIKSTIKNKLDRFQLLSLAIHQFFFHHRFTIKQALVLYLERVITLYDVSALVWQQLLQLSYLTTALFH